jgi:hypothetical protein
MHASSTLVAVGPVAAAVAEEEAVQSSLELQIDNILSLLRSNRKTEGSNSESNDEIEAEIRGLVIRIDEARQKKRLPDRTHIFCGSHNDRQQQQHSRSSLVVGENELIRDMNRVIHHDPTMKTLGVDHGDARVGHLSRSFLVDSFVDTGLRSNLFLRRLSLTGVELENDFLSALGSTLSTNIALTDLVLSDNHFTNDGLVEFLHSVGSRNDTCQVIDLRRQRSPVFERQQCTVLDALEKNHSLVELYVDVDGTSKFHFQSKLNFILLRNQELIRSSSTENCSRRERWEAKLLEFLRNEAEMAEYMCEDPLYDTSCKINWGSYDDDNDENIDWEYLYKLSQMFYACNTRKSIEGNAMDLITPPSSPFLFHKSFQFERAIADAKLSASLTPDGSFLTEDFISRHLKEDEKQNHLVFDFCGQSYVFKRFTIGDPSRTLIVTKFVDSILSHPQTKDITHVNMANSCLGSDFLALLAERCLGNSWMLPKLNSLNVETNYLGESGIVALSKCIADPNTWKYLQFVKLENQKRQLSSRAEAALARAVSLKKSVVSVSLRVRNLREKQLIDQHVASHIDLLRRARQRHETENGGRSPRKRTEMEQLFDQVAANDPNISELKIVADRQFTSLSHEEKMKAASALKSNNQVKSLTMNALGLDDEFALKLAESLKSNSALVSLHLDNNSFSGKGITAMFRALSNHPQLVELQIRHQSKVLASVEENNIPELLQTNMTLIKVGVDLRSKHTEMLLDRKLTTNRQSKQRSLRSLGREVSSQ